MTDEYTGPANWRAKDLQDEREWIIHLTPEQIAAFDAALKAARASGATLHTLTRENFPLKGFDALIADVQDRLENGRGIVVLRGLPALQYNK